MQTFDIVDAADDAFGQKEWKRGSMRYVSMLRTNVKMVIPRKLLKSLHQPVT